MRTATRILVADDEAHARTALGELLRDEGYDVELVGDGQAAWESLAAFHPDLVLSDVEMPRMNGLELAELMQTDPLGPPLILMSSREPPGGSHPPFVQKPIALGILLAAVRKALAEHARRK